MVPFARYKHFIMVNQFMRIPAIIKATVAVTLIDVDRAARYYMLFNKSLKCALLTFGMAIVLTDPLR